MLVTGLAGLLQVGLEALVERIAPPAASVGLPDFRGRVSFSGALALIGLVAWLVHWGLAERAVRHDPTHERGAAVRKLFLYAVLLIGGLILTFALQSLVGDLMRALFGHVSTADLLTGTLLSPASLLLTVGALWLYHRRVAALDRAIAPEHGAGATLRRWWLYGLSFVGLLMLLVGAIDLIRSLWQAIVVPAGATAIGRDGLELQVAGATGSIAAGLVVWLLSWRASTAWLARTDDPDPESRSVLRKVYLYLVLGIAVAWTIWNLGQILYGLLRVALLGGAGAGGWSGVLHDLGDPAPAALVFAVAWLYHGRVVRREAALAGERREQATIRWLYEYLVALVGIAALSVGLGGTLATVLDLAAQPGAVRPTNWWQDRISLFATLAAVGLPLWLAWWTPLQREAADAFARTSLVRRIYLFLAFGLTVLTLLTSGAYALYQLMRLALGEGWSAGQTTDMLSAVSAAAVAAILLVYHLRVFRGDGAAGAAARPAGAPVVAVAVVRAADPEALAAFQRLLRRAPAGVEVELRETDPTTAAQINSQLDGAVGGHA
jgi:hypothetical protein